MQASLTGFLHRVQPPVVGQAVGSTRAAGSPTLKKVKRYQLIELHKVGGQAGRKAACRLVPESLRTEDLPGKMFLRSKERPSPLPSPSAKLEEVGERGMSQESRVKKGRK